MDNYIKYVCKRFRISQQQLLSHSRKREIVDARSVLYAILPGTYVDVMHRMRVLYRFEISRSSIINGRSIAGQFYHDDVQNFNTSIKNN
jgi:hypothetical protein